MIEYRHDEAANWHALDVGGIAERLHTGPHGLTDEEASRRLTRYGPNRLSAPPRKPAWLRFARQFHNVLIYVMLAAAAITILLGHLIDTAVLLFAVIVNACIGFIQEGKAEQAIKAIRNMLSPRAAVLRDGERIDIDAGLLVPGDVVILASGDKVPADLRLIAEKGVRVNEAVLTGESEVVEKSLAPVAADAPLGDRAGMLYRARWWLPGKRPESSWQPDLPPKSGASARCSSRCRKSRRRCCARSPSSAAGSRW